VKRLIFSVMLTILAVNVVMAAGRQEGSGKQTPVTKDQKNQIYDEPQMPIRTQYPPTMHAEGGCSGEGCGFTFTCQPQGNALDKAEVHIFLPRGAATAAAHEPFVTGPRGLLESNGWKKETGAKDTAQFPYGWVKKVIGFSDPRQVGMRGEILLGEAGGQAVQVTLYYPGALSKAFLPNADVILGNLHFKRDKLPLGKSGR